jgi:hypothetical protein
MGVLLTWTAAAVAMAAAHSFRLQLQPSSNRIHGPHTDYSSGSSAQTAHCCTTLAGTRALVAVLPAAWRQQGHTWCCTMLLPSGAK